MRLYGTSCAALLALAVVACSGGNPLDPTANQLQVGNAADNFQWQASNLNNVSQTLTYTWSNTGTMAHVNNSSTVTSGTATLTIKDAASKQVYSGSLTDPSVDTQAGTTGAWTIVLKLSGVTGTLNFRVQKTP